MPFKEDKRDPTHVPLITPPNLPIEIKRENEFGTLTSKTYLHQVKSFEGKEIPDPVIDTPPYYISIITYVNYLILIIFGHVHDFLGIRFQKNKYTDLIEKDGMAPWYSVLESFYVRTFPPIIILVLLKVRGNALIMPSKPLRNMVSTLVAHVLKLAPLIYIGRLNV